MIPKALLLSLALRTLGALHESLAALPVGWIESQHAVFDDTQIQLQVALQYRNLDSLKSKLADVSAPGSARYGQYLDREDIDSIFRPSKDAETKVQTWLKQSGASNIASDGSMITFTSTVGNANKMLGANFSLYSNGEYTKLRTLAYFVPDDLGDVIDLISPTTYFGNVKAHRAVSNTAPLKTKPSTDRKRQLSPSCEVEVSIRTRQNETLTFELLSPLCLKELYNMGNYRADPSSGSTVAFGSFLNQSASYSDLTKFEETFNIPSQNFSVLALINGGVDNQDPLTEADAEANMDVQSIVGLVDGLPVGEYMTGGLAPFIPDLLSPNASSNQNEPYLQLYQYLLSQPNSKLPYVISNSYGDHENTVPERYARRVCNQIGMIGMRGRTILESSGDEGVGAVCRASTGAKQPQFTTQFPGTCPYETAVGGMQFFNPEYAWNASSGGFSFYFPTAWYQKKAVHTYLSKHISPATKEYYSSDGYTNFQGRGVPDISAHSLYPDYLAVINGTALPNGGTSAAAPVVAAIIALLNDARFCAEKPAMGFINPWLYRNAAASALNDITLGGSLGCNGVDLQNGILIPDGGKIPFASWNATVGWDPVTVLGTPNFMKMKSLALQSY